jgi:hypothetical protein
LPLASKPTIQQIGVDKILLRWQLVDSITGLSIETKETLLNTIAYFKVEYKINKQASKLTASNQWLTIDEQIDARKREYILTDLNHMDVYRFRITTFLLNGDLLSSHSSLKFKLEQTWSPLSTSSFSSSTLLTSSTVKSLHDIKLSQIKVHITQVWAITANSLGLRWKVYFQINADTSNNKSNDALLTKINGFYIYYRKIGSQLSENSVIEASSDPNSNLIDPQSVPSVPLFNYTRINVPVANTDNLKNLIDTYLIANLDESSQYEIKMTCYNLNGDLCSFSNTLYGLTLASGTTMPSKLHSTTLTQFIQPIQSQDSKSKQNEILFMILGVVLGILTLLLIIFIGMCIVRQRQHKMLLAQLHNTSQKLTSSSCPTLIYEDSLRNQTQNRQLNNNNYTAKLIEANLFANTTNDSNSTNSQSMSTTTSSMTTPPALNSAQTNNDNMTPSHILLLNGNTVSAASLGMHPPPPIPQNPPPSIGTNNNTSTLNRININLNPLNSFMDTMSPTKAFKQQQQSNENFYHTLTALGNLPATASTIDEINGTNYVDYNNTTLNLRAHLLLKQQQQQQQILINTLKQMNMQKQLNHFNSINGVMMPDAATGSADFSKSPSASSMRRNSSISSSKKSKKSLKNKPNSSSSIQNEQLQQQQQQQNKNYYLLPNMMPTQSGFMNQASLLNNHPIYNETDLLNIEAALNQNNISLFSQATNNLNPGNIYLLNNINQPQFNPFTQALIQQQQQFLQQQQPQQQQPLSPHRNFQINNSTNGDCDSNTPLMFQTQISNDNSNKNAETPIYETSESEEKDNHYASSGLIIQEQEKEPLRAD